MNVQMLVQQASGRIVLDHPRACLPAEPVPKFRVVVKSADPFRQLFVVADREQKAIAPVLDEFRDAADTARNIRQPARHRLEVDVARSLVPDRRANEAIGRLHERHHVRCGSREIALALPG